LTQAAEALTSAGDSGVLWIELPDYYIGSIIEPLQRAATAANRRLSLLRNSVLFSALAAEAYANEFLWAVVSEADAESADRLATADKLLLGPRLAGLSTPLDRAHDPLQAIIRLCKARNALVHPKPSGYAAYIRDLTDSEEEAIGPKAAARYLVAVARTIVVLDPMRPRPSLIGEAMLLATYPQVVCEHVRRTGELIGTVPKIDAPRPVDLLEQTRRRHAKAMRREQQGNA
jgi:hypothetical protein